MPTIVLDASNLTGIVSVSSPHNISIQGTFDSGTVTHYTRPKGEARGAAVRTATTVEEAYKSEVVRSEFVISGGSGSESVKIIATRINS